VLDRVRADHVVRCGAVARPGLADLEAPGGLLVDLCRAVAAATLGPSAPVAFRLYDSDKAFDAVRHGKDDVFFLDAAEVIAQHLAGVTLPGPTVFVQTTAIMVKDGSPAHRLTDLAGQPICFLLGDAAQRHLEAWFAARHLDFVRMAYQEPDEMTDAFDAGVCHGVAGEVTELAATHRGARLLPDPLAAFPIMAMTGTADAQWAALVAWTMDTVIAAATPPHPWAAGGLDALALAAPELGLPADWQRQVIATVGTYTDIWRRTLGAASPYRLPQGLNAPWSEGPWSQGPGGTSVGDQSPVGAGGAAPEGHGGLLLAPRAE
jgi:general L-amino acid transport system substrate-binding protein